MTTLPLFRTETLRAIEAVQRATIIAEEGFGRSITSYKHGRDVVTEADVAAEDAIRELLAQSLEYPVVGEERGGKAPADGSPYWLLDPICGTRNYASGLPLYCTNLALVEKGQVTVAAVGDALGRELQVAEAGSGAWALKDGAWRSIQVSAESRVIVADESKSGNPRRAHAARFIAAGIQGDRWDQLSLGSTVAYPQLAAGRIAAYVVFWAGIEHIAAGTLVAQEAGAIVTQVDGRPWSIASDSFVAAASRELHAQLLSLARGTA